MPPLPASSAARPGHRQAAPPSSSIALPNKATLLLAAGHIKYHRPSMQIEHGEDVWRLVVGGQELVPRFHTAARSRPLHYIRRRSPRGSYEHPPSETAGMPQIAASTARRSMARRARSSADNGCAPAKWTVPTRAKPAQIKCFMPLCSHKLKMGVLYPCMWEGQCRLWVPTGDIRD